MIQSSLIYKNLQIQTLNQFLLDSGPRNWKSMVSSVSCWQGVEISTKGPILKPAIFSTLRPARPWSCLTTVRGNSRLHLAKCSNRTSVLGKRIQSGLAYDKVEAAYHVGNQNSETIKALILWFFWEEISLRSKISISPWHTKIEVLAANGCLGGEHAWPSIWVLKCEGIACEDEEKMCQKTNS